MTQKYEEQITKYTALLERREKVFLILGYSRLALLALLAYSLYRVWAGRFAAPPVLVSAVLLAATVFLWVYHARVHRQVDLYKNILMVNRQYLQRISGEWTEFSVDTPELPEGHPYRADLDITGAASLFQLLNVAQTWHGRKAFSEDLLRARYTPEEILLRQQAVRELAGKTEFTNLFQCHGLEINGDAGILPLLDSLGDARTILRPPVLRVLLLWIPPLVTLLLTLSAILGLEALYVPGIIVLAAQAVFWLAGIAKTNSYLSEVTAAPQVFGHYAELLELLRGETFESVLLRRIQDTLATGGLSACAAMKKLDSLLSWAHIQGTGIPYFIVNVLFLWDYRCALALSRWKEQYGIYCEDWFEALGEFESLLSLAGLPNVCAGTSMPEITDEGPCLQANRLGHPLLPNSRRVCNDIAMDREDVLIISGSNMSGKTTFLRTVGINLVLAAAGGAVCAQWMRCSLFYIMSSMRIADDLGEGVSTFYAELTKIGNVLSAVRSREDVFFLIDEIFRGTNSEDRLYGAGEVIRELAVSGATGMITTHDLSLCDLEAGYPNLHNYSFSERYEGDEMFFDYRMERGRSRSTNARFLMKKIGIIRDGTR